MELTVRLSTNEIVIATEKVVEKRTGTLASSRFVHNRRMVYCHKHPLQPLVCPICEGAKGGKKTAVKHPGKAKEWGKRGGRPKKKAK